MNDGALIQGIHDFIRHLLSAVAAAGLYGMDHRQVERLSEATHTSLVRTLSIRPDIAMLEVDGELIIDGEPLPSSLITDRFARYLRENGIGHLRFLFGVPQPELVLFIAALAQQQGLHELCSSEHIRVGLVEMPEVGEEAGSLGADIDSNVKEHVALRDLPAVELARMTEIFEAVKRKERLKPSGIAATVAELVEAFKREGEAILVLAALREQDEYTFTHAANVSILTIAQAISLGIEGQLLNDIGMAAILHDIGKLFVPVEILSKDVPLTEEEFALIRTHPAKGGRYLLGTPGVPRLAAIVAYEHHMHEDLSGYPSVPSWWRLNLASQLTSIADVFDAMRTRRSYQEPHSPRMIANLLLAKSGIDFNPMLIRNFLHLMSRLKKL